MRQAIWRGLFVLAASAAASCQARAADAAASYERLDDPYLRARSADVLDVGRRVAEILTGSEGGTAAGVLVAAELGAAEVAGLDATRVNAALLQSLSFAASMSSRISNTTACTTPTDPWCAARSKGRSSSGGSWARP